MRVSKTALGICVATAAGLSLLSVADAGGFRRYIQLRQQVSQLEARNKQLAEHNAQLIKEVEALRKEPKALERAAREELGFIKPGEVVFNLE